MNSWKFFGVGDQTPHPQKILCANPSLSSGELPVKISTRKNENEVNWRGPKNLMKKIFGGGRDPLGVTCPHPQIFLNYLILDSVDYQIAEI